MNYIHISPKTDQITKEILVKIRLSMNGVTAESMTNGGIVYKKNYGVAIHRIKEIAQFYPKEKNLADNLWQLSIRETMIMATLLQPVETFNKSMAEKWCASINQLELAEQACMNLFSKLPYADELCLLWTKSANIWQATTGFLLASRLYNSLSDENIHTITATALSLCTHPNYHLYKSIALCLGRFCRTNKELALKILSEIEKNKDTECHSWAYIFTEVREEMIFLDIL